MPIHFTATKSKKELSKGLRWVYFPEKIKTYLVACQDEFSSYPTLLNELTDIGDTLLTEEVLEQLLKFCGEIEAITKVVDDYSFFDKWKSFNIRQDDLRAFAIELTCLIRYAQQSNLQIWSVGE